MAKSTQRQWMEGWQPSRAMRGSVASTAAAFGLDYDALVGPSRAQHIARARQAAYWVIRKRYGISWLAVAACLGRKEHHCAIYGAQVTARRREQEERFRKLTDALARGVVFSKPDFSAIAALIPDRGCPQAQARQVLAERRVKPIDAIDPALFDERDHVNMAPVDFVVGSRMLRDAIERAGGWPQKRAAVAA